MWCREANNQWKLSFTHITPLSRTRCADALKPESVVSGTASDAIKTPTKFLLEVGAKGIGFTPSQQGVAFTVPNPSFRVRLDCQR